MESEYSSNFNTRVLRLFIRERTANSIVLGNYENSVTCVIPRDSRFILFREAHIKGIDEEKPYHLKRLSENRYAIKGTAYSLVKEENRIELI